MARIAKTLKCPKCNLIMKARLNRRDYKFLLYRCPRCLSNVVYYSNRIDTISDKMVNSLFKTKKLRFCGDTVTYAVNEESRPTDGITKDKIIDLKILLETEQDFNTLLSKL